MSTIERNIKELIIFFVKENYNKYLSDNNLKFIEEKNLKKVISDLYHPKKEDLKVFVKNCMKETYKNEYPGDLVINNIFYDIYQDDDLNINRMYNEIKIFQENQNVN